MIDAALPIFWVLSMGRKGIITLLDDLYTSSRCGAYIVLLRVCCELEKLFSIEHVLLWLVPAVSPPTMLRHAVNSLL
jgi:hypothetical protein